MSRKPKINTKEIISLIEEGKNTYEIAKQLNVTPPTVKYWINKLSIEYTSKKTWKLAGNPEFRNRLNKLLKEGKSIKEIADEFGVTNKAVKYWIKKLKIKTRKDSKPHKVWRCPICGELLWGHDPEIHLRFVHNISG